MNKKELSNIKKQFKVENEGKLRIGHVYNAYCKSDGKKIIFAENTYFDSLDQELQEMFYANFKKLLTGSFGAKLFELDFEKNEVGSENQGFLLSVVQSNEDFEEKATKLTEKIIEEYSTEGDFLVSVAKFDLFVPTKSKKNDEDDGADDKVVTYNFILCSVNAIEPAKKALKFDYQEKELTTQSSLDLIINLNKPMEGFLFPTITDGFSNVNKVVYCSSRANVISQKFANGVLGCEVTLTAKQEKDLFDEVLTAVLGNKVKPQVMHNIYENIVKHKIDSENPSINTEDIKEILQNEGLDISRVDSIVADELGLEKADIKVNSIIPSSGKSIKLGNSELNVAVTPAGLKRVKQTVKNGKKCLIIELDESVNLDTFELEIE